MLQYLVLVGAAVTLAMDGIYIAGTIKGRVRPNKVTWLMWTVAPLIATAAALSRGVTWAAVPVFIAGFGPLIVFAASFINRESYWKISKFDIACGVLSLAALVVWYFSKQADYAILFSILSDGAAGLPTVIKSWKYPETESAYPYAGGLLSPVTAFFAIEVWNFTSMAFPIYLIVLNVLISVFLLRKRVRRKH